MLQVNHSQRLNEKPLTPWIIAEEGGKIISAHCDCVAGLGECCSHIASLLWAVESGVRIRDSMTVTEKKAYWVIPAGIKQVPYAQIRNIKFQGKKSSHQEVSCSRRLPHSPTPGPDVAAPDDEEMKGFYSSLALCSSKPAILSLVEPYSNNYVPKSLNSKLPMCLSQLFRQECLCMNYGELLNILRNTLLQLQQRKQGLQKNKQGGRRHHVFGSECVLVE